MLKSPSVFLITVLLFLFIAESCPIKADVCVNSTLNVNHVQGHVVYVARGMEKPIPNAEVELKKFRNDEWQTKYKVTTDKNGFFQIGDVPSGKYEIHVVHPMIGRFGTMVRVIRKAKSNPRKEIIVVLEFMKCGDARVHEIKRK